MKNKHSKYWAWGIILLIVIFTAAIRIRLLQAPLERDEGAYAYGGQLILQGLSSSARIYLERFPAIYYIYALIMATFGQTHVGIHFGLLVINAATIVLLFLLGRHLFNPITGVVASASFAVLSLSESVQGIFANAEHFVILSTIGGILIMLHAIRFDQLKAFFLSGILLGLAFVIKQHAIFFVAFAGAHLLFICFKQRPVVWSRCAAKCTLFLSGVFILVGLTSILHILSGTFENLWFWVFKYPGYIKQTVPISIGVRRLLAGLVQITQPSFLLCSLAGIGIATIFWDKKVQSKWFFISGFFIFSFLSICPGFYFRPHYFILLLPAVALLVGIAVSSIGHFFTKVNYFTLRNGIAILIIVIALFSSVFAQREFLFQLSPKMLSRTTYEANPFPESLEIAKYIKQRTSENDCIAVFGSEPQICFYANRHSATGHIMTYSLMEESEFALKFQQEMIREIETAKPEFLVYVHIQSSWLRTSESEKLIFRWFDQYCQKNFERVGIVDILSPEATMYYWDDESVGYSPRSKYWLSIFRRRNN